MTSSKASADDAQVLTLARAFRWALEKASLESYWLAQFPKGACTHASRFLSQYLFDNGVGGWGLVSARRASPAGTHAWLASGPMLLDITADQFDRNLPPVILERRDRSSWHQQWVSTGPPYVSLMDYYSATDQTYLRDYAEVLRHLRG